MDPRRHLKEARRLSGLSQRALAARAGTSQSVVARIESGQTSPSVDTLVRLLDAAGLELRTELVVRPIVDSHMLNDVERILSLTPEQRLEEVRNVDAFVKAARRV